jgi:rhodanese-related sulfurtransferase
MTAWGADDLLALARSRIRRVRPEELEELQADGALVVDIRPEAQRAAEGELGFGVIVERNVLEWRFDLLGSHALPEVTGYDQPVVVVCSEGYASSLAAASLREMGFTRAGDLTGGYLAWRRWREGVPEPPAEEALTAGGLRSTLAGG